MADDDYAATAEFSADVSSVAAARQFVRLCLEGVSAPEAIEVAALLVSELVANAVVHVASAVTVAIAVGPVRAEVSDRGGGVPALRRATGLAEGGRGLVLVDELAAAWGVVQRPTGKTVWFTLDPHRYG